MVRYLLLVFGMSRMKRRSGWQTLIAVCFGLTVASQASALGLGEIELDSALNERLVAEIELLDASGLQPTEIIVSLASNEDFKRIGVERFFFLTDLRFKVVYGSGGGATVAVTSSRPISEPYLNFIVEVMWPSGRLLKEYTVLLDPPTFSEAAAPRVSAPTTPAPDERVAGRIERSPTARSADQVRVAPARQRESQPAPSSVAADGGEYRMTDRNDTLWTIASDTRTSGSITVQQNMLAIQRLNPRAFIRNNINLLKAGYVLRLPSENEALSLTTREAVQEVAVQTQAWQAGRRGEQLARSTPDQVAPRIAETDRSGLREQVDATASREVAVAETTLSEGQLRIVAGQGNAASGNADATDASEQINAALEEQDRLTREVDELTYQLDREQELATSQLAVKDRQLQVKDQQIAELQSQMTQIQQELQDFAAQNQNQNVSTQASLPWWQSPYVLGGGLGVLVLLLVIVMIRARRAREASDEFYAEPIVEQAEEPVVSEAPPEDEYQEEESAVESLDSNEQFDDDQTTDESDSDVADEFETSSEPAEEDSEIQGVQTSDVIGEADIYIAYGRYPQAIALLLGVIDEEPERNDVRLKLLELYVETHDKEAFNVHMVGLLESCDDEDALLTARELEGRLTDNELAVDEPLEGVPGGDDPRESEASDEPEDTRTIDEFDLDLDNEDQSAEPNAEVRDGEDLALQESADDGTSSGDTDAGDFELELDDFDAAEGSIEAAEGSIEAAEGSDEQDGGLALEDMDTETSEDSGDDLGGDLGLDFDAQADVSEPQADTEADTESGQSAEEPSDDTDTLNLDDIEFDSEMAEEAAAAEDKEFASEVATAEEDEFEFADEADSANTKLDLARAYIDMGDEDGARDILKEVMTEGNTDQQQQAEKLLDSF
ncbi:MAG: hypothetical protein O7F71_12585 [Gammaproteobacteria bacterium]|nr:hypothetical protein [Gammaproteobacteria bacterium]